MNFYVLSIANECTNSANKDLNAQYQEKWCVAWAVDRKNGECEKCPLCGRPVSMRRWMEPRKIKLIGRKYPDKLGDCLMEPLVISERFADTFREEGLTGIRKLIPVEVVNGAHLPRYFCAEINFDANVWIDSRKSEIIGQKHDWSCALCNPTGTTIDKIVHVSLNTSNWGGADVFKVYSLGTVVSQRFYDLVRGHRFTNFDLTPIELYHLG